MQIRYYYFFYIANLVLLSLLYSKFGIIIIISFILQIRYYYFFYIANLVLLSLLYSKFGIIIIISFILQIRYYYFFYIMYYYLFYIANLVLLLLFLLYCKLGIIISFILQIWYYYLFYIANLVWVDLLIQSEFVWVCPVGNLIVKYFSFHILLWIVLPVDVSLESHVTSKSISIKTPQYIG